MSQDFLAVATPSVARIPLHEPRTLHGASTPSTYHVIHEEVPPSSAAAPSYQQTYAAPYSPTWRSERSSAAGRGGSPGRDALGRPVYLPATSPGGAVTDSFLRYHADPNSGGAAAAAYDNAESVAEMSGRPSGGGRSHAQAELVQMDREVASLREELASRTQECSMLKSALQREHEAALRMNTTHAKAIETLRAEHDRQTQHLSEQLAVMKGVAEGATADRKRLADDAAQRKAQLMNLLERERDEKSRIMAEYRQQTEQLIAEQAAEISGLRELLDAAKAEEERFLQLQHRYEEQRADSEHALMRLESALNDERLTSQRSLREAEHRHQAETDEMRRQTERRQHEVEQQMLKLQLEIERREDAVRTAQDRIGAADHRHDQERAEMKGHYEGCIEALTLELNAVKSSRDTAEASLRAEMEETLKANALAVAALRSDLETARRERMEEREASRAARDDAIRQAQTRIRELEAQLDEARADVLEERALRKDAEATRQSLTLKAETQQATITRLNTEVERLTVDGRTRERQAEQQHMAVEDSLRAQVRQLESEASRAKQNVARLETELERVVGKRSSATQALEEENKTLRRDLEEARATALAATTDKQEAESKRTKLLDTLLAGKVKLESENHSLAAQVAELEARFATANRQLGEERDALDRTVAEAHRAKELVEDLRCSLDVERARCTDALQRAERAEAAIPALEDDIGALRQRVMEAEKKAREAETALHTERATREDERGGAKAHLEARVAQLQEELAGAVNRFAELRDARAQLEEQLRVARDEATRWQREAIAGESRAEDRLRSSSVEAAEETRRMESILASVREECSRAQAARSAALRDAAESAHDADRRIALMQEALDAERASKHRLHDELRSKEQAAAEAQGTMRLLSSRIQAKEDEVRRLEEELHDATTRIHEAHTTIGKKEALVGQLSAKLKVLETHASSGAAYRGVTPAYHHNDSASGVQVRIHSRSRSESFTS